MPILKHSKVFQQVNSLTEIEPGSLCHIAAEDSGADKLPGLLMVDGQVLPWQVWATGSASPWSAPWECPQRWGVPQKLVLCPVRPHACLHTRGEFLLAWISSAASVTSCAQTANPGPIYQAIHSDSQVRLIIKTLPLSLWGSPGFCLMQQTDGTEEIQVVRGEIWGFFNVVARIFQID